MKLRDLLNEGKSIELPVRKYNMEVMKTINSNREKFNKEILSQYKGKTIKMKSVITGNLVTGTVTAVQVEYDMSDKSYLVWITLHDGSSAKTFTLDHKSPSIIVV
jgi:hypothetical protein